MKSEPILILASQSPRRGQLLKMAGLNFQVLPLQLSEIPNENLNLQERIVALARAKVEQALAQVNHLNLQNILVLTADTEVCLAGQTLGKPSSRQRAKDFISALSGKTHQVLTAVAIARPATQEIVTGFRETNVSFRNIGVDELECYLDTKDWQDKAGGYGIQSFASRFVSKIDGTYDTVVGLPVDLVFELADQLKVSLPRQSENTLGMNLRSVRDAINRACEQAGRHSGEVSLLAVSKTFDINKVKQAYASGQILFGENYVQEFLPKRAQLPEAQWDFIGHLQSNKAKAVVGRARYIHSIDRATVLHAVAREAAHQNLVQDVLIEVNIWGESSKSGVNRADLPGLFLEARSMRSIRLRGLMALPPLVGTEDQAFRQFCQVKELFESIRSQAMSPSQKFDFSELSMGTSGDFVAAIRAGSTIVRIGTAVFGDRGIGLSP